MSNEVNGVASSNGTSPIQNGFSLQSSSSSFLTKAQQAALDAALEKKDKAASMHSEILGLLQAFMLLDCRGLRVSRLVLLSVYLPSI